MDQDLKKKWVEALRSGDYEQGMGCLRSKDDEYCCLGVLADIVDPDAWEDGTNLLMAMSWRKNNTAILPQDVLDQDQWVFTKMNDGGYLFADIADYIEVNL